MSCNSEPRNPHTRTGKLASSRNARGEFLGSSLGLQTGYPEVVRGLPGYSRHVAGYPEVVRGLPSYSRHVA
jgi:hypothetical protein